METNQQRRHWKQAIRDASSEKATQTVFCPRVHSEHGPTPTSYMLSRTKKGSGEKPPNVKAANRDKRILFPPKAPESPFVVFYSRQSPNC
jgi:hypothetical protein